MERLSWELSVLSRAIAYQNLSGASGHVGLSQPQLSRIIGKLEGELGITLLDRGARRKSAWTPFAQRLVQIYVKSSQTLSSEIHALIGASEPNQLNVGTLEGLIPIASAFGENVLQSTRVKTLELNVHDLNMLEELFFKGELHALFTFREPGRKKFKFTRSLGYQQLQRITRSSRVPHYNVMSSFEFGAQSTKEARTQREKDDDQKYVISNSLTVRRSWIDRYGGTGIIPSEVRKSKNSEPGQETIYLIGADQLSTEFWNKISNFRIPRALEK